MVLTAAADSAHQRIAVPHHVLRSPTSRALGTDRALQVHDQWDVVPRATVDYV